LADVVDGVELVLAFGACAKASPGIRSTVVAAARAFLVQKPRFEDIAGYLQAGARPVLEERYEAGPRNVSAKMELS